MISGELSSQLEKLMKAHLVFLGFSLVNMKKTTSIRSWHMVGGYWNLYINSYRGEKSSRSLPHVNEFKINLALNLNSFHIVLKESESSCFCIFIASLWTIWVPVLMNQFLCKYFTLRVQRVVLGLMWKNSQFHILSVINYVDSMGTIFCGTYLSFNDKQWSKFIFDEHERIAQQFVS